MENATIVGTVVDAFTELTSGLASSIVSTFQTLVMNANGTISTLGIWGLTFISLGFGFGLLKKFTALAD